MVSSRIATIPAPALAPWPRERLHAYQNEAVNFILDRRLAMITLKMGLGKTIVTLTAIRDLLHSFTIYGALVVAPRRVAETVWKQQAAEWGHTEGLRICVLRGASNDALARQLTQSFDVWIVNYEKMPWLFSALNKIFFSRGQYPPFNMIVFDEITRIKNLAGTRIGGWYKKNRAGYCMLDYFQRRVGLTGTPAPNGYFDLLGQYYALDKGERLGRSKKIYKEQYFIEDAYARRVVPAPGSRETIQAKVADITLVMRDRDYLKNLPKVVYNDVVVDLPSQVREVYDRFEDDLFVEMDAVGGVLRAANTGVLSTKCHQIANGRVKDSENSDIVHQMHDEKIEALDEILEEASGSGVLVNYHYRADLARIQEKLGKKYRFAYLGPGVKDNDAIQIVTNCNRGLYDGLLANPKSAGHGLNIQKFGWIAVWYGLLYNAEEYLQANGRFDRQGQSSDKVFIYRILARNTVDFMAARALACKIGDQCGFEQAIIDYRNERKRK